MSPDCSKYPGNCPLHANQIQTVHHGHIQPHSAHTHTFLSPLLTLCHAVSFQFLRHAKPFSPPRPFPGPPFLQILRHLLTHNSTQSRFKHTRHLFWSSYQLYSATVLFNTQLLPCLINKWMKCCECRGTWHTIIVGSCLSYFFIALIIQAMHKYIRRVLIYLDTFVVVHKSFRTQNLPGSHCNSSHVPS